MTNKPKTISDTARALLTSAATRGDRLIRPPQLPIAAARQVVRSLLNAGLAEVVPAPIDEAGFAWRTGEDGGLLMLRATAAGIAHVTEAAGNPDAVAPTGSAVDTPSVGTSIEVGGSLADMAQPSGQAHVAEDAPDGGMAVPATAHAAEAPDGICPAPGPIGRGIGLRRAALALLDAWERHCDHDAANEMTDRVAALRAALRPDKSNGDPDPRPETKRSQVLAMLRRGEGASGPQIAEAMHWEPHTVRGFLAGLAKKGIQVNILDRVPQVSANKQGAKGSYTIYRLSEGAKA
jgi:hypothetical protein